MTPQQVYSLFRSEVVDTARPYLWSDTEVTAFSDLAQEEFCRLTGGIQDASSALTELSITATNRWVTYPPQILRIVSATLRSTGLPIAVLNPPEYNAVEMNLPGPVVSIIVGLDDTQIRVVQVPTEVDVVDMVIERLPLETASEANAYEIPEHHHYYLTYWMKHLAYRKQDSETFDLVKSEREKAAFEAYCAKAFAEKERRKNKPRLMVYGGIGGSTRTSTW